MHRRTWLLSIASWPALANARARLQAVAAAPIALHFPADFGAHPEARTEWWYVTGSLHAGARLCGFQVTFFRAATGIEAAGASRFAATQLLFAHAALTDLAQHRLRHDQRIARGGFGIAQAAVGDTDLTLRDWRMQRLPLPGDPQRSRYTARVASDSAGFRFELQFDTTQPVLLQGNGGVSRKGPGADQASRYYSEPQLAVQGTLTLDGAPTAVQGRGWLDHEWSDSFMPPQAVGWDWIGMNLDDGSALTAFRLRRADGSSVYAGGGFRRAGDAVRNFGPGEVRFTPLRRWQSAASGARYPVQWRIETPAGTFGVAALLDDQELDSRASTGAIYWEGLSDLTDAAGRRVGRGYLEMTGYAATLRL
ncbi:MAG: carotenoid 1,2-hydratase [Burkholderiales bacterium]|nr:carotenoid 1,2-hydratase [Burkholderiales bacterium]